MDSVRLGDVVQSQVGLEAVMMMTHEDAQAVHRFVRLHAGNESVTLTSGHYIFTTGGLKKGGEVRVGEWLVRKEGVSQVWKRETVVERGLYNPHTGSGTVFVNGFLASCYTEAVEVETAHSALSVVRWTSRVLGRSGAMERVWRWVGQTVEHIGSGRAMHLQRKMKSAL